MSEPNVSAEITNTCTAVAPRGAPASPLEARLLSGYPVKTFDHTLYKKFKAKYVRKGFRSYRKVILHNQRLAAIHVMWLDKSPKIWYTYKRGYYAER